MSVLRALLLAALLGPLAPTVAGAANGAAAPPAVDQGRALYEERCSGCHTIGQGARVGPDLAGVTQRRSREWLLRFVSAPEELVAANDPTATALVRQFNQLVMPNLGLDAGQSQAIVAFLESATGAAAAPLRAPEPMPQPPIPILQSGILAAFLGLTGAIFILFAWVGGSTRRPAQVDVHRAYGLRRVLFVIGAAAIMALLVFTLPITPYAVAGTPADRIIYVAARQYDFVFSDEPITSTADFKVVPRLQAADLPAGSLVEFRVTSLDVNHGFGLYGPDRQVIAQTQAMPGYFNRLRVRLDAPGRYRVFCMEYCAAGHHLMQASLEVR